MRASLAELAGSPRQAAAAAAAGAADRAAEPRASADHGASSAASAASAASGNGTSAAAASAGAAAAAATAAATAAAPLRVLQAELRRSGGFAIVDEELGQDDVGKFFLSEGDHGKRLLRRCLLAITTAADAPPAIAKDIPAAPHIGKAGLERFRFEACFARAMVGLPYSLKTTQRRYVSTSWTTVSPEEKPHRSGIGLEWQPKVPGAALTPALGSKRRPRPSRAGSAFPSNDEDMP